MLPAPMDYVVTTRVHGGITTPRTNVGFAINFATSIMKNPVVIYTATFQIHRQKNI